MATALIYRSVWSVCFKTEQKEDMLCSGLPVRGEQGG